MPVPLRVVQWVDDRYKRPRVDPQWLNECYNWLTSTENTEQHNPDDGFEALVDAIKFQLLESNFCDSMLPGTGLPTHITDANTKVVLREEIMVEITALTEIGTSAFSLNQTRIAREERVQEGNIVDDEGEGDIDIAGEGPMPKYPRGMLHFQLSDGVTTIPGIEYRSLPELSLENTPLGYKMILKNVRVHKGIAYLEPRAVVLLGHKGDDREDNRKRDFAKSLRSRMRLPEPESADEENAAPPPPVAIRSPLREISTPLSPPADYGNDDEDLENRRRRIPVRSTDPPAPSQITNTTSAYFSNSNTARSPTLIGSPIPFSLSPTLHQNRLNFSPPPSPQPDEDFWLEDEHQYPPKAPTGLSQANSGIQLKGATSNITASGSKGKGKHMKVNDSSDEYDDDFLYADDILAEVDAIEKASVPNVPQSSTVGSNSSGLGFGAHERGDDVVIIEDSDDDDKENAPVPTRHVKRRLVDEPTRSQGRNQRSDGRPIIRASRVDDIIEIPD
ncbi:hypothetical protein H0H92_005203 [Tricholoma furcatifolium]|nr:hypothetical protein H0H92_005203 [Tricholoma furcatifolium]